MTIYKYGLTWKETEGQKVKVGLLGSNHNKKKSNQRTFEIEHRLLGFGSEKGI